MTTWTLPEHLSDVLPAEAQRIEALRRRLLDTFRAHGYELVMPPLVEYLDSLLTGTGRDMDVQTFKLVDRLSGKTMGVRADITPQVARIDAHLLNRQGVTRLCYMGSVLHTLPEGVARSREPLQMGAEVYGHAGIEADIEMHRLVVETLRIVEVDSGLSAMHVELGHVGVFKALCELAMLENDHSERIFSALQSKDSAELARQTASLNSALAQAFCGLPSLCGGVEVLELAARILPQHANITAALNDLRALASATPASLSLGIDLADVRGYHYHSGIVFAAYVPGMADAILRGGRYDEVGRAFGRARPATGFSMDLREVARVVEAAGGMQHVCIGILAPWLVEDALVETIAALRTQGEIVVQALPGHDKRSWQPCCNRELVLRDGKWAVTPLAV
jgi:ATP phosphoribosyltransferase regulatory subunit